MAGCLKSEAVSGQESSGVPRKKENGGDERLCLTFGKFLDDILKEGSGISCYRPLPARIGDGQEIDLFELYKVVRRRGGYCSVSEKGLWGSVAVDSGFDSGVGVALKLVYVKYLDALDRLWKKFGKDRCDKKVEPRYILRELDTGLKAFLLDREELPESKQSGDEDMDDAENKNDNKGGTKNVDGKGGNVDDDQEMDRCRKRKRDCCVWMLSWIRKVAKDPCSSAVEQLPEKAKWDGYGSDVHWKKVLWAREVVCLKKNDGSLQQSVWQKYQKMNPGMYDNDRCSSGRLRCSQRLILAKDTPRKSQERCSSESSSSGCQNSEDTSNKRPNPSANSPSFWEKSHRQKRVSIGKQFQAELPEFCVADYGGDSKWLGTKIWPLKKGEYSRGLIERDPIGKGRLDLCGCQFPSSSECIQFHVREKQLKIKLELGPAFSKWKFDGMGEDVALLWTKPDEDKFREIVESNRLSSEKYFWDELFKLFPIKGREALVSYYFNVFLLRRRGEQNRNNTGDIDSDDEESEYGPVANKFGAKSIFCSPKKPNSSNCK